MESQPQSLSKFIDGHWGIVKKKYGRDQYLETRDFLFDSYQRHDEQTNDVLNLFMCLQNPLACAFVSRKEQLPEEKPLNCDWILAKMNIEKIPIYIQEEDLNEAIQRLKENFHFLTDNDPRKGWKFAMATNFKKWAFFGLDTRNEGTGLCSSEIFDVRSMTNKKSLDPFLRHLLTILNFDEEEVTNLFDAFEESRKPVQRAVPSIEESKRDFLEELKSAGMDQNSAEELLQLFVDSHSNPGIFGNNPNVANNLNVSDDNQ